MSVSIARIRGNLRVPIVLSALLGLSGGSVVLTTYTADAANTACAVMTKVVHERVSPGRQTTHLTLDRAQSDAVAGTGFTSTRDTSMLMAAKGGAGLQAVHRLRQTSSGDYLYSAKPAEMAAATGSAGYHDEGVAFYASASANSCRVPVYSYVKAGRHRFVTSGADRAELQAGGWRKEGVRFYARKPAVDSKFSIAVMPDTQEEVFRQTDGRFLDRSTWLVKNRASLDLRYVTHTGDVVNWDTPDHAQYDIARRAFTPLNEAGIPYSLSIGNHDTQATGVGGSARDGARTHELQRDTTVFNRYLDRQETNREGAFEAGKLDNSYHVFTAGGRAWLVLNLELWPRKQAVAWAAGVVRTHPRHNVIVVTHAYLTGDGKISTSNGGYGDTSPRYLYDNLVGEYANVRMVFSGHVGQARHRSDIGKHGNRIDSFLTAMHSGTTNPMRLVEIDTATGSVTSKVYAPWTDQSYSAYRVQLAHRGFVR